MTEDKNHKIMLSDIPTGSQCMILKVYGHGGFRHRILELGFVRGETVKVIKNAPLMDPIEYEIMGSHISLRRSEACHIEVISLESDAHPDNLYHGTIEEHVRAEVETKSHNITVALLGNPNCGKTSFFNFATGMHEKVGNYSGVTVNSKAGVFHHREYTINLVDLPGTYSLAEFSPDELYVRDYLNNQHPDIILNIVDAGNIERNLFLTTQLIDRNPRMVMALNMYDELQHNGYILDHKALSRMLGFPIVPLIAKKGWGIDDVLEQLVQVYEGQATTKHIHINYGDNIEKGINEIKSLIYKQTPNIADYPGRYMALRLLQNDQYALQEVKELPNYEEIVAHANTIREGIEKEYKDDITSVISGLKYGFIRGALSETLESSDKKKNNAAYSIDNILTHRWLGLPILILFMCLMFEATFRIGGYVQDWMQAGIDLLSNWTSSSMPDGMLKDLTIDGIITGVGGVLVFLPNILILFIFISILEDTGYMARAAFIMDRLMHQMGLHGKSFIPYITGLGCSVPAVMATRILENPKDRILTMITVPFMSCATRLTVYLLFVSAFFDSHQSIILLVLYLTGVGVAIVTSLLLNKFFFKGASDQFVMELPPYRIPTMRNVVIHMWDKSKQYLKKMGTVILLASIIIWALGYFPRPTEDMTTAQQLEQSYIGQIGHFIEPAVRPLGLAWQEGVALLTGCAAKEIIISSMEIFYAGDIIGNSDMTAVSAFAMLIFIMLYFPCIATIVAIAKESNYRWAIFSAIYSTLMAWLLSFIFYQTAIHLII